MIFNHVHTKWLYSPKYLKQRLKSSFVALFSTSHIQPNLGQCTCFQTTQKVFEKWPGRLATKYNIYTQWRIISHDSLNKALSCFSAYVGERRFVTRRFVVSAFVFLPTPPLVVLMAHQSQCLNHHMTWAWPIRNFHTLSTEICPSVGTSHKNNTRKKGSHFHCDIDLGLLVAISIHHEELKTCLWPQRI